MKYTFVHLFWFRESVVKFPPVLIESITLPENGFCVEEQAFVTPYENVYEAIKGYPNTFLLCRDDPESAGLIRRAAAMGDWLILHSIPSIFCGLKIPKSCRGKIVMRTWGHDVSLPPSSSRLKQLAKDLIQSRWRHIVRQFYAIGVANAVDTINVRRQFGDVRTYKLDYLRNLDPVSIVPEKKKEGEPCQILIGHSGNVTDNHIPILHLLERFKEENLHIWLILSYGVDRDYMESVRQTALSLFGEKVSFLNDFLPIQEYLRFMSRIDIGILDGKMSHALGTVSNLLYFGKKLYVNEQGVIHEALTMQNVPHSCISEIGREDFASFSDCKPYTIPNDSDFSKRTYEERIGDLHSFFQSLKEAKTEPNN